MVPRRKRLQELSQSRADAQYIVSLQHPEWLLVRDKESSWTDNWKEDRDLTADDLTPATFTDRPDLLVKAPEITDDPHDLRQKPPAATPRGLEEVVMPHANAQGIWYGPNQEWYRDHWQQLSGCGPVSASLVTAYLARFTDLKGASELYTGTPDLPSASSDDAPQFITLPSFVSHMETLWDYVTPTKMGTWKLQMYEEGIERFAREHGVPLEAETMWIPPAHPQRRSERFFDEVRDFVVEGLSRDIPVAFLNYFGGQMRDISNWHWVTVTSARMTEDEEMVWLTVSDQGMHVEFSLNQWFYTSYGGGGFVSFYL